MSPEVTPESVRDAQFRSVIRGLDPAAVSRFQAEVAARIAALEEQNERLTARLGDMADRDLKSEFEVLGNEVTAVLEAAREAAEAMRERATLDAARWRSEAMAESEQARKEARSDAEALRGDAWTVGTEMLTQAVTEANRLIDQAERDAITITGEAERDAHRLVSGARREAEDMVRSATMDAEKLTADANKAHDELIEQARRQAEASQERTRALEQRREELMAELEGVRSTLSHLEGTLEAKREDLNLSRTSDSSVRVVPAISPVKPEEETPSEWVPGETVRVVRGDDPVSAPPASVPEPSEPVPVPPAVRVVPSATPAAPLEPAEPVGEGAEEAPDEPVFTNPELIVPPVASPEPDDVGALFASLREPGAVRSEPAEPMPEPTSGAETSTESRVFTAPAPPRPTMRIADDLLEQRDAVLLPITNRALRGVKKAITEAQNVALDGLRTSSDWKPSKPALTGTVKADLIALWSESFSAGHDAAEAVTGEKLKRPPTPDSDATREFVADLVDSLTAELGGAGDGQRERQSAASKVFRAWRNDEAERRIRQLALRAYHAGFAGSAHSYPLQWVASGTPCSACQASAADPASHLPPVHAGCECTLTVER